MIPAVAPPWWTGELSILGATSPRSRDTMRKPRLFGLYMQVETTTLRQVKVVVWQRVKPELTYDEVMATRVFSNQLLYGYRGHRTSLKPVAKGVFVQKGE